MSRARAVLLLAATALSACGFLTEQRLVGKWRTVQTPERTLELRGDHQYSLRFTGKVLGILSNAVGPETGTWVLDGNVLVLTPKPAQAGQDAGGEPTRWAMAELTGESVLLGDDRWKKLP